MHACTKLQLIWKSSVLGSKFAPRSPPQKKINHKDFEKTNVKIVVSIEQCTPVPNFSQFGELEFLGPNLPKTHSRVGY